MKTLNTLSVVLTMIGGTIAVFFSLSSSFASRVEVGEIKDSMNKQITAHVEQNKDDMKYIRDRLDEVYKIVLKQNKCIK